MADTYFAYDEAGRLLGEYDATGVAIQETVWLGDIPVATIHPKQPSGYDVFYVWSDNLNSPRAVSDATNQLRWTWEPNDPFGKTAANENPAGLGLFAYNLRFPGQYYDQETGLHYNYFRDYDPGIGRYVQSDPIGLLGGLNSFAYAGGSPLVLIDPAGLCEIAVWQNGSIKGWKPCYPEPPKPHGQGNGGASSASRQCDSCQSRQSYNPDIPDADLTGVRVPRNDTSLCTANCALSALGHLLGKETLMFCIVEPRLSSLAGHLVGRMTGAASLGYGSYSATREMLNCPNKCEARLNTPLPPGFKYAGND